MVGFSNAINLTDGLDGLAAGCTISVAIVFAIMAYLADHVFLSEYLLISHVPGTGELSVICGALIGGCMAFLWFNSHPAEVFMGDTGSLALGGLIGVMAFMIHQPLTLVIAGGVFVLEAVSVILQVGWFKVTRRRFGEGRRLSSPDVSGEGNRPQGGCGGRPTRASAIGASRISCSRSGPCRRSTRSRSISSRAPMCRSTTNTRCRPTSS